MNEILPVAGIVLLICNLFLILLLLMKASKPGQIDITPLKQLTYNQERLETALRDELGKNRQELTFNVKVLREELALQLHNFTNSNDQKFMRLTQLNEQKLDKLRETVETKLIAIQDDNSKKLEEMRATVDEKLHATLEKRLGESFQLVSERLEQVHKGLGEMQQLAVGVGDLKKVLSNVKTRGIWGEMQLASLLEQVLTPEQYAANVATKRGSQDRVEFAVRLPGRDSSETTVWLPIDAKFPQEDYQRLLEAQEAANSELAAAAAAGLETRIRQEAKTIREKYIDPPNTTDFAILFLPVEGLYAEVLRRPGLCDILQREYRINVTGPTTLAALLNSLQMGFRTLAIEKRSSEVWTILGAVKTEFGKFGDVLMKTKEKLDQASRQIDAAAVRTRAIERKLKTVEQLPVPTAVEVLGQYDNEEAETG
ncbi:DNA recombination protein RmuC [Sporomusa sphaeroides]|uniref:RmuC family protein n=2 Tax=Sporomusa TaxID=2375 RepID=A0ABP2CBM5_9FIRM|nr:DNA recombination protein RmuC [Sporomusa sphaeroides]OLS58635.1 RmuC family protein [Sporomusa sphaeroides DSM 2875]CVK19855.1 RmuC family protein [Sporomusa sphaeroides DSM 2875]SCM79968.1 DNA recombination protein RmuC [uncultured Sporomusa sp.]